MPPVPEDALERWFKRFEAVAKAQSRYLYVLAAAALFYLALWTQARGTCQTTKLPVLGLDLDSCVLLATAPMVLGLISLVALGTFPALREAYRNIKRSEHEFESHDTIPTALDFLVYPREGSKRASSVGIFIYPAFVTLALIEGTLLWVAAWSSGLPVLLRVTLLTIGGLTVIVCLPRLLDLWAYKTRQFRARNTIGKVPSPPQFP